MKLDLQNRIDGNAAATGVFLYFASALLILPRSEYSHAVGGGIVVFGAVAALSAFMRRGWLPGWSVLVVGFTSTAILVMPTLPAMGGTERRAIPLGFLGVQAAILVLGLPAMAVHSDRQEAHAARDSAEKRVGDGVRTQHRRYLADLAHSFLRRSVPSRDLTDLPGVLSRLLVCSHHLLGATALRKSRRRQGFDWSTG